jgi:hypothetical protein
MKSTFFEEMSPALEWNELARKICKRNEENKLVDQEVLDDIVDEDEEEYDDDTSDEDQEEGAEMIPVNPKEKEKPSKKPTPSTKAPKEKSTAKPKTTTSMPPAVIDSENENDESEADDDYNYSEEDEDQEDREDEAIIEKTEKNKDVLVDGITAIKEVVDNGLFGKLITQSSLYYKP